MSITYTERVVKSKIVTILKINQMGDMRMILLIYANIVKSLK